MLSLRYGVTRVCRRALSDIKATGSEASTIKSSEAEEQKPLYATKVNYDKSVVNRRTRNAEEGTGQVPTAWQKRFLVLTKLYAKKSDIPEYVSRGTMDRMHDRLRVVYIIVACFGFFTIFYIAEAINANRIARDRERGVVVTKM